MAHEEEGHRRLTECPSTCYGYDCDYWLSANSEYTCAIMESTFDCDCGGCACGRSSSGGGGAGGCPATCFGEHCDYWESNSVDPYTCTESEADGCDCRGCACTSSGGADEACLPTCYGYNCNVWQTTNSEYGCDCSGCTSCQPATSAPTPSDVTSLCYTLAMHDAYGNGWGGARWTWKAAGDA